jgi:hypothetical protein
MKSQTGIATIAVVGIAGAFAYLYLSKKGATTTRGGFDLSSLTGQLQGLTSTFDVNRLAETLSALTASVTGSMASVATRATGDIASLQLPSLSSAGISDAVKNIIAGLNLPSPATPATKESALSRLKTWLVGNATAEKAGSWIGSIIPRMVVGAYEGGQAYGAGLADKYLAGKTQTQSQTSTFTQVISNLKSSSSGGSSIASSAEKIKSDAINIIKTKSGATIGVSQGFAELAKKVGVKL